MFPRESTIWTFPKNMLPVTVYVYVLVTRAEGSNASSVLGPATSRREDILQLACRQAGVGMMRSSFVHRLASDTQRLRGRHKNLLKGRRSPHIGRPSASRVKATSDDELYPSKLRKLMNSFNMVRSLRHI